MIAALTGQLAQKTPSSIVLDVHGVGYDVCISLSTFFLLPNLGDTLSLKVHTHFRDNAIQLFGFLTQREKEAFVMLTGISGVGGKLALSVLSTLSIDDLLMAIETNDLDTLVLIPGIGKKSAGRIVLELKEKVARLAKSDQPHDALTVSSPRGQLQEDAVSALVNLGYRAIEVKELVKKKLQDSDKTVSLTDLIRESLKDLRKGH